MPGRMTWIMLLLVALMALPLGSACSDKEEAGKASAKKGSASEGRKKARKKKARPTPAEEAAAGEAAKAEAGSPGAPQDTAAKPGEEAAAMPGEEAAAKAAPAPGTPEAPVATDAAAAEAPAVPVAEQPSAPPLPSPVTMGPPPPQVEHLLSIADLVAVIHTKGWVTKGPIVGLKPDEGYNSVQYEKPGTGRIVTLQLWKASREEAIGRWNNMLATWPNALAQESMVTQDTFFWNRGHLFGLVFLDTAKGLVVSVACHTEICTDTQLLQLTLTAFGRLKK